MTIEHARTIYQQLLARNTGGYDVEGYYPEDLMEMEIRRNLKEEKANLSALDVAGKKSVFEMEKELKDVLAEFQVNRARAMFEGLKKGTGTGDVRPEHVLHPILGELQRANADLSALDPDGKKSADDMQEELDAVIKPYRVKFAQALFARLPKSSGALVLLRIHEIRVLLGQAGEDAAVLDVSGKKSAEQVEAELAKHAASAIED